MLITGLRTHKVYPTEHKSEEVQKKYYFREAYTTKPSLTVNGNVTCTLDQETSPFKSVTVTGTVQGDVEKDETKTFKEEFSIKVKGYH